MFRAWMTNYIHTELWDVITHSRPNFSDRLLRPYKLGYGWVITFLRKIWIGLIIHAITSVNTGNRNRSLRFNTSSGAVALSPQRQMRHLHSNTRVAGTMYCYSNKEHIYLLEWFPLCESRVIFSQWKLPRSAILPLVCWLRIALHTYMQCVHYIASTMCPFVTIIILIYELSVHLQFPDVLNGQLYGYIFQETSLCTLV